MYWLSLGVSAFFIWVSARLTVFKNDRWLECVEFGQSIGLDARETLYCADYLSPAWGWWALLVVSSGVALVSLLLIFDEK